MTMLIETREDAFRLASGLFSRRFPDMHDWFQIAWEGVLQGGTSGDQAQIQQAPPLPAFHASSVANPMLVNMVDTVALMVEVFVSKFPLAQEDLMRRIAEVCRKHGKSDAYLKTFSRDVTQFLEQPPTTLRWMSPESGLGAESCSISQPQEQQLLKTFSRFDLFINRGSVSLRRKHGHSDITLEERVYRLLVMFLRYKDRHLPATDLFMKAWCLHSATPDSEEDIVSRYLKPAVSVLRQQLTPVQGFEIPHKQRYRGYICRGTFSFCVLIAHDKESEFRLNVTD